MIHLLLALFGVLPPLLLMAWFDRLDAKRPEPRRALRRVALAGALSVVPVTVVEEMIKHVLPTRGVLAALLEAFVMAALVEESAKALCVRWFV